MKLTVLGGSAAGPNTGQGCSGYLVETGSTRLVLDLGPGTLPELRRHADFRTLDGVVASHLHVDHVLDLVALRFALAYNPQRPPGPVPLWLPPGGRTFLDRLAHAFAEPGKAEQFFPSVFTIAEYEPERSLRVGDCRLDFAPTVHYVPCWAIRVSASRASRDLVYTADTGPAAALAGFGRGAGVMIAEAGALDPSSEAFAERGHLTAKEAATLAREAGVATLVLAHLWEEGGFDTYRAEAASVFPGRLELARPGLQIGV